MTTNPPSRLLPGAALTALLVVLAVLLVPAAAGAAGTITPTRTAPDITAALANPSTAITGSSFVTVPPNGNPDAVSTLPLAGFPLNGGSFAILSNGDATLAPGTPPTGSPASTQNNFASAEDGGGAIRGNADANEQDVSILKVDLNVPATANCLSIDFRFLSEEYPEFVGDTVNDSFVAELDTDDWTTSSSTGAVTAPHNFAFDAAGRAVTVNTAGITATDAADTIYDGATAPLVASTPITPGAHSLYLSIFDQGDQVYDSAAFLDNLTVGQKPAGQCTKGAVDAPLVTLDQPANGATVTDSSPTFSGQGGTAAGDDPSVTLNIYQGSTATGTPVQTQTTSVNAGAWSIGADPLPDGIYTAQAVQSDTGGNTGTSDAHTFTVETGGADTTPPAVGITSPAPGAKVTTANPTFSGPAGTAAGDDPHVQVDLFKGATATGAPLVSDTANVSGGKWSSTPEATLSSGTYTLRVTQTDAAGNTGTLTRTFTAAIGDTDPPDVTLFPVDDRITTETPALSGDAGTALGDKPSVRVDIYPGTSAAGTPYRTAPSLTPDSTGHWHYVPVALALGTYTAQATQVDAAGNVGKSTPETFTVVPAAPANLKVTVTQSPPPILVGADLTFTVTVTNLGPGTATGVNLTDQLPLDATLPEHEAGAASLARAAVLPKCTRAGRNMTCGVGSLAKGQSTSYKFVVVPRKATDMTNTASAAGDQVDPATASNSSLARTTAVQVPRLTKTIDAAVIKGQVRYRKRGSKRFKTLTDQVELPVGSLVDATKGRVRITSARDAKGHVQTADFYSGEFLLRQRRANHGLTTLLLRGSSFAGCPAPSRQANAAAVAKKKKRKRRSLWGSGKGSFRTGGRYGSATVRGTIWFTQDNCRSTFFKTARGVVSVRDYVKGKTVAVPKGKSYTARAPR